MKINELIDSIEKHDLVLPEFQREFVWSKEQAKQLIVSLVQEFPIGSLLFWKTDKPPALKNVDELPEKFGTIQVILDGQQRLTTLYMLITGNTPPFYTEKEIKNDPRDLCYNLESGVLQYYQASRMRDNPLWCEVVDCLGNQDIDVIKIAKKNSENDKDALKLAQVFNKNLNQLQSIPKMDLPLQKVPHRAVLGEAIDIFDRVNRQGTKLTDAELALTHITGKWADARRLMKEKIAELSKRHFQFNLKFMTRALVGVVTKRALFAAIHDRSKAELKEGWDQLDQILDYLVSILPGKAFIHSTDDLNTTNVLVPLTVYLSINDGKFPNEQGLKRAIHWMYAAHMWKRYTAQTDQRLEHDISLIMQEKSPWEILCNQVIDQRGRIKVKEGDLEGRGVRHPLFLMTLTLAKAHGAVDWFNGIPLGDTQGRAYNIHRHHIFPQSILYEGKYDAENHLHRKIVNEIANRAFLTADTNISISNNSPEEYLPQVEENYPGALVSQFIPMNPSLWKIESYSDFLEARRHLIARKINDFMESFIAESEEVERQQKRPIGELVKMGESATLEFKSTLQWDIVENQINKHLRHSVLKTIAAFLNSDGGTLVIGVEDDGSVFGLENDLKTLEESKDRFSQLLTSLVSDHIGAQHSGLISIRFEDIEGKKVCIVETKKSSEPAFLKGSRGKEFYVRFGPTTRMLDAEEITQYIKMNWE